MGKDYSLTEDDSLPTQSKNGKVPSRWKEVKWRCPRCGELNKIVYTKCGKCYYERGTEDLMDEKKLVIE